MARANDEIVMLGVIQEQHADRCQLFAQWQQIDWPIVRDPVNLLGLRAVPILVAIDEQGVVQFVNPDLSDVLDRFLTTASGNGQAVATKTASKPDLAALRSTASDENSYVNWRDLGDALVLWGAAGNETSAIEAFGKALAMRPGEAEIHFRLGVAYRLRYDALSNVRQAPAALPRSPASDFGFGLALPQPAPDRVPPSDFQLAVDQWGEALALDANHYIYRRRIEQYGPRLSKPYPFYDWVERARREIVERGDVPIELSVEPRGAELAGPDRQFTPAVDSPPEPDPLGRIHRDRQRLVRCETVVVPTRVTAGQPVRVHVEFVPSANTHWNNEGDPLTMWVELPDGWEADRRWFEVAAPEVAESKERRSIEFEVKPPLGQSEPTTIKAYALYYVCEDARGACMYLRHDIEIPVQIAESSR